MNVIKYGAPAEPLPSPDPDGPFVRWDETASQATGKGWVVHIRPGLIDGHYMKESVALSDYSLVMEVLNA